MCDFAHVNERFPQEARRDGVFAGLTSGLAGGKIKISDPRLRAAEMVAPHQH